MNPPRRTERDIDRECGLAAFCVAWSIAFLYYACTGRWDVSVSMLVSFALGGAVGKGR